ncbi:YbfB/YjiJ family MFS transporter [Ideonella oryzae]|uniref:YbfB/YjiJ family MFS transporter n=1 Tax=Ideonella oryzae TaxID=2937441 RepID=A0ABT1BUU7_9BURK|nr:YbfB/YjiJ family MFS transporter [Ideonella oryzae]MCO5979167.1 YbfB/YjiJ family MFS transporter [Ideonella oryzae]
MDTAAPRTHSPHAPRELQPWQVLAAGVCALLLTVGLARFAYTPLLPVMQDQAGLSAAAGGWLASWNYAGYMAGCWVATWLHQPRLRFAAYRLCLVTGVIGTAGMGLTQTLWVWGLLRFIAGVAAVGGMLLGSGMVLAWLVTHGRRPELGIHFIGLGLGLAVSGVAAMLMAHHLDWAAQWQALGLLTVLLAVPAWHWMPAPAPKPATAAPAAAGGPAATAPPRLGLLLPAAYFCAGVGYVISATFLVAIVVRQPGMAGGGNLTWVVVGLAAAPAVIWWDRLARCAGDVRALLAAYAVQIVSFLLPLFFEGLAAALLGAVLYGATFIGIVGLTLAYVGRHEPANPARAMARLTLSYGAGQILAPAVAGQIAQRTGSYQGALWMAAAMMALGMVLLGLLDRQQRRLAGDRATV